MGLIKIYFAQIWDEKGEFIKNIYFNKFNKTFSFNNKSFNIKLDSGSYFDKKGLLWNKRYYIYNLSNPDPLVLNKKVEPIISPDDYNTILETNHLKKLNDISKNKLSDLLNPKNLIIGLIIIAIIYFAITGQLFP